jgi:esterase/lipase
MKRTLQGLALVGALAVIFLLGPQETLEVEIRPIQLPEDIDAYLAESEERLGDVAPHAAKTVRWLNPTAPGRTDIALVYVHGFSATRQETLPLTDQLADQLKANVFYARLSGHGRSGQAMAEVGLNDWLNDLHEAITIGNAIGNRVILVGSSTGGTLATLTAMRPEIFGAVDAIVVLSPNYGTKNPGERLMLMPWGIQLAELLVGKRRSWTDKAFNEEHRRYWTTSYPTRGLHPMVLAVDTVRHCDLSRVGQPFLILYSRFDEVVDPSRIESVYTRLGSSNKRLLDVGKINDYSNHVLAGDVLSPDATPEIRRHILDFLSALPQNKRQDGSDRDEAPVTASLSDAALCG